MTTNHQVRLMQRPVGEAKRDDFAFVEEVVAEPAEGQVLIQNSYLSLDPAMRGWMREGRSYIEPVALGDVMRAGGVGEVIASRHPKYVPGNFVSGMLNVQEYCLSDGKGLTRVDPALAPLTAYLNVLGMPGMTAYFGLLDVGLAKPGETVVVSGATGAVGATVGQIARILGCRVVGIAGGADKCAMALADYGYDACIDYKNEDVRQALKQACPKGIDVYFDNVGGDILDAVLTRLALKARIVICGAISQYNATGAMRGPANYLALLAARARMEGMVVFDYAPRFKEAAAVMAAWMMEGKLKSREHVVEGLQDFPERLMMLFRGENLGKLVLKVRAG